METNSVTPEPRLDSARIRLELLSKKHGSARAIFQKARMEKNWQKRAYFGTCTVGMKVIRIQNENL